MYCLINVEQKGKFLSIYFSFIFSCWFFALGSGSTIYIFDLRKFYPAIVPSLYVSAKFRAPPKKKEKKRLPIAVYGDLYPVDLIA